jgi:mRNA-degrading endonuclease RelE of RelBE toxin-antitoxin system
VAYKIEFTPEADAHFKRLTARERSTLVDQLEKQLVHQPGVETRNRKPMRPNPIAPWELRVGHLRVYYEVSDDPEKLVTLRAIGTKVGNKVRIGDEWWEPGKAQAEKGNEDPGDATGDR